MSTVEIQPMPEGVRKARRFRPNHPPIFSDGNPTPANRELAMALWRELDAESKRWYVPPGATMFVGLPLSQTDIESCSL